jgi:hypothetical protein
MAGDLLIRPWWKGPAPLEQDVKPGLRARAFAAAHADAFFPTDR